jgi:hypothetical protein
MKLTPFAVVSTLHIELLVFGMKETPSHVAPEQIYFKLARLIYGKAKDAISPFGHLVQTSLLGFTIYVPKGHAMHS